MNTDDSQARLRDSTLELARIVGKTVSALPASARDASHNPGTLEIAKSVCALIDAVISVVGPQTLHAAELQSAKVSLRIEALAKARKREGPSP
jgi:hypothetical protein